MKPATERQEFGFFLQFLWTILHSAKRFEALHPRSRAAGEKAGFRSCCVKKALTFRIRPRGSARPYRAPRLVDKTPTPGEPGAFIGGAFSARGNSPFRRARPYRAPRLVDKTPTPGEPGAFIRGAFSARGDCRFGGCPER
jgi:hypothetical protein